MSIRVEQYDGDEILYIGLDPDGVWARSEFPDELITLDYNSQGKLIGIEAIGSAAKAGATGLLDALLSHDRLGDPGAVRDKLAPAVSA